MHRARRWVSVSLVTVALLAANALPAEAHDWHYGKFSYCEFQVRNHGYNGYSENGIATADTHTSPPESLGDGCSKHRTRVGNDCGWEYAWGPWGTNGGYSSAYVGNVTDVPNGCQWWSEHYLVLANRGGTACYRFNFGGYYFRYDSTCSGVNADEVPTPNPNCPNPIATVCNNLEVGPIG